MYRTAQVVIDQANYQFDKAYTYLLPEHLTTTAKPGCRVSIPFGRGNKKRTGLLLSCSDAESREGLKPLTALLDATPLLDDEGLRLLRFIREQTFCTWFDALRLLIPAGIGITHKVVYEKGDTVPDTASLNDAQTAILHAFERRRKPMEESELLSECGLATPQEPALLSLLEAGLLVKSEVARQRVADEKVVMVRPCDAYDGAALSAKQKVVYQFLLEAEAASLKEICYYTGVTRAVVDALCRKGAAQYYDQPVSRNPYESASRTELDEIPPLTPSQQAAYETLSAQYAAPPEKGVNAALLYGVTGSGKTLVFLKLVAHVLAQGKSAIVLVPEIAIASQLLNRFHQHFGGRVAVLHSALSLGERMDEWRRIRSGGADIVIGTRSAVFAPLKNIGLIVMDEEQEHSYRSDKSPRFHARDIARLRCEYHRGMLVLSSATPSIESFYAAKKGAVSLVEMTERFGKAVLPEVSVVDLKNPAGLSCSASLSGELMEELHYNLTHGEQSILLLNRRGYSVVVKCSSCGTVADCPNCSIALTYHTANDRLMCHYCGYTAGKAHACQSCGSEMIRYSGAGTQKLEEELRSLYPDARILRVDTDTTMSKFSHEKLFASFAAHEYDIIVGTQMVAKGLNFPDVTLVGVICADQSLYSDDFRSFERSFSLLTQVVGRSGRGERKGRALIQTYSPENPIIRLAAEQNYNGFYRDEIVSRRLHLYPPFCTMTGIGFVGTDLSQVQLWSTRFLEQFRQVASKSYAHLPVRILGPVPADIVKAAGKYRYKLIVKCKNNAEMRALLRQLMDWFFSQCRTVNLFIDMHYDRI